jgi:uncharacterized protein (DUF2252 family)
MSDLIHRIRAFNADREPERLALKFRAMRQSAFAFFRGSCHLFYADWPRDSAFDGAPLAWICGDLHLENFGSYKGDNRLAYFDLNDFDEACLAPATWELARFITSLFLAGSSFNLTDDDIRALSRDTLRAYAHALQDGKARWLERATATGMIRTLLRRVKQRTRRDLLDKMTTGRKDGRKLIIDGVHRIKASRADRAMVASTLKAFATSPACPEGFGLSFFRVLDVTRRIAGTGSLGLRRWAILVEGHGGPDAHFLLDLKEARPSALAPVLHVPQPAWASEAQRVVAVQRRAEAIAPALLHPVLMDGHPFVLKELQPADDRLTLTSRSATPDKLGDAVRSMGLTIAWSHLRSGGRQGSATTDSWMQFGAEGWWPRALVAYARRYRSQVLRDYAIFAKAYDAGAFDGMKRVP